MAMIEWRVYADEERSVCLAQGVFPTQWVGGDDAEGSSGPAGVRLGTLYPQIIPEIAREASKLVALRSLGENEASFPVRASAFGLQPAADYNGGENLFCVLKEYVDPSEQPTQETALYQSWLDAKLQRAEFHRQRGNDRYKNNALQRAIRAYEKALQWLACPLSQCTFSALERERVHAIAIPCHANLATCHWKESDMDACIQHATHALALDPSHTKARYRRSQAYIQTKQFDDAVTDLESILNTDPSSKLFSTSLAKAKLARQQHRQQQTQALASAFQG